MHCLLNSTVTQGLTVKGLYLLLYSTAPRAHFLSILELHFHVNLLIYW